MDSDLGSDLGSGFNSALVSATPSPPLAASGLCLARRLTVRFFFTVASWSVTSEEFEDGSFAVTITLHKARYSMCLHWGKNDWEDTRDEPFPGNEFRLTFDAATAPDRVVWCVFDQKTNKWDNNAGNCY